MSKEAIRSEIIHIKSTSTNSKLKPLVIIEAKKFSFSYLRLLWDYRELCYFFIWRDLAIRYRQTMLGAIWAILQPLITMIILNFTLGSVIKIPTKDVSYPIFFYSGLALWIFFSNSVTNASSSLIGERSLITKVYFPKMILTNAKVLANLSDLGLSLLLLAVLGIFFHIAISWKLLLIPIVIFLLLIFTCSISMLLASLNVIYRDVRYALPFVIQVLFFFTPIIFPLNMVSENYRWLLALNPLAGIIEIFRALLFNHTLDFIHFTYTIISTILTFFLCAYVFIKLEKIFAEKI